MKSDRSRQVQPSAWTWRAFLTGAFLCAFIGVGTAYNLMVIHGSYMAIDFSAAAAVFLFFVWTFLINTALARFMPRWPFTTAELKLVYVMMLVACAIPSMGLTAQILPIITAPFYFATPENGWAEMIQPHIPRWLAPEGRDVIRNFYEGFPGGAGRVVPWGAWIRPLLIWASFLAALYVVSIAMMVILRRQWMEHERLVYPLAQLPIEMAEHSERDRLAPFFRSAPMWVGFVASFALASLIGLNHYFPAMPYLKPAFAGLSIFRNTEWLTFRLSMPMLGFFYLVHLDVAFSMWFFNLLSLSVRGVMKMYGVRVTENLGIYGSPSPVFAHLGMGAMIVLVFAGAWTARHHLSRVFRRAFRADPGVDDSHEVLSYRTATFLLIGGSLYMALWLHATGMPLWAAVAFLAAAFVLFVGLTRIVAESGMAEAVASTIGSSFVVSSFGTQAIGPQGLVSLALTYVWAADIRTFVMASTANGLKVVENTGGKRRPIFWAMLAAIGVCFIASCVTLLTLAYRYGGIHGNDWFFGGGARAPYEYVIGKLLNPESPNGTGWLLKGIGAAGMTLLMALRTRFLWFPFHPIGFAIGPIWIMDQIWFTVLLAWAIKYAILRLGGIRLYRKGRPFFLGLILGQFTCNGFWLVVDFFTGTKGNVVFWI